MRRFIAPSPALFLLICSGIGACSREPAPAATAPAAAVQPAPSAAAQTVAATPVRPAAPADVVHAPENASRTPSGIPFQVLVAGTGEPPRPHDQVQVHYTLWTRDGTMLESTRTGARPVTFEPVRLPPAWAEGIQGMVEGEERRFWVPAGLGIPEMPGLAGPLLADVGLVGIARRPAAPDVPADVAAPPPEARRTPSSLAHRVLRAGTGAQPGPDDRVEVHYTVWTTDGRLLDSTVPYQRPRRVSLRSAMPGWQEALQLMREGEQARVWMPEALAFQGKPGKPRGAIVMDIELARILR